MKYLGIKNVHETNYQENEFFKRKDKFSIYFWTEASHLQCFFWERRIGTAIILIILIQFGFPLMFCFNILCTFCTDVLSAVFYIQGCPVKSTCWRTSVAWSSKKVYGLQRHHSFRLGYIYFGFLSIKPYVYWKVCIGLQFGVH